MEDQATRHNNAPNPYAKANFLSKLFLCWVSPILSKGFKNSLEINDIYAPLQCHEAKYLTEKLESGWKRQLLKFKQYNKKPNLFCLILSIYWPILLRNCFFYVILELVTLINPVLITRFLEYFSGLRSFYSGLFYGTCICLWACFNLVVIHPLMISIQLNAYTMRASCCGLIYKKIFSLKQADLNNGFIVNMFSSDLVRVEECTLFMHYMLVGPIQLIAVVFIFYYSTHYTIIFGISAIAAAMVIQLTLSKISNHLKQIKLKKTDRRIDLLNEVFDSIKIIKMYCWEEPFKKLTEKLRIRELNYQTFIHIITAINCTFDIVMPHFITFVGISFFVHFSDLPMSPKYIVFAMAYYFKLNTNLSFFFTRSFSFIINGRLSFKRIENFLLKEEINDENSSVQITDVADDEKPLLEVNNLAACWKKSFDDDCSFSLVDVNFRIEGKGLIGLTGPIGSGKSCLLNSILKETLVIKGNINVKGSIFYVSQEPWIFSASLRQNVLFGKPYEKNKYKRVIRACCLDEDLMLFSSGDQILIGEKGINLSGGQKARVCLARALYHDAQIYLLDDPLSAVDANVAKKIYTNCIKGYLCSKICVLVTHQIRYLNKANEVIILNNGHVVKRGSYSNLFSSVLSSVEDDDEVDLNLDSDGSIKTRRRASTIKSVAEEEDIAAKTQAIEQFRIKEQNERAEKRLFGAVSLKSYAHYFNLGAGPIGTLVIFLLFFATEFFLMSADYWVTRWSRLEEKHLNGSTAAFNSTIILFANSTTILFDKRKDYYFIYSMLMLGAICVGSLRSIIYYCASIRSSKKLHKNMFNAVISTRIRFFDVNPVGRIINRFAKDISNVDEFIPVTFQDFLEIALIVVATYLIAIYTNYWIAAPLVPFCVALVAIRNYYITTSREISRLAGIYMSPIFTHTNATVSGIVTIRACRNASALCENFFSHLNLYSSIIIATRLVNRWVAIRLDWLINFIYFLSIYMCLFLKDVLGVDSSEVAIMLVYLYRLFILFQWGIRQSCQVEESMTTIERIFEYSQLKPEEEEVSSKSDFTSRPHKEWPSHGKIQFENVCFTYDEDLPLTLKNLSFTILPKEKIGIIGRTGAGKSSLFQALFRMSECHSGAILIDNVNIKNLRLQDLRKQLSIIPQDPILFSGTIRSNLDPFHIYSDLMIWDALAQVQLKQPVIDMKGELEAEVLKSGSNLSVGQKQLICLARAILKKSKILIIDEATANVDYETDALIQKAIRECFKECTVLTIAHRLQTIIDSDRIMCLESGNLKNFGSPYELLVDKSTILHQLVYSLDESEANKLVEMAKSAQPAKKTDETSGSTSLDISPKQETLDAATPNETSPLLLNEDKKLNVQ